MCLVERHWPRLEHGWACWVEHTMCVWMSEYKHHIRRGRTSRCLGNSNPIISFLPTLGFLPALWDSNLQGPSPFSLVKASETMPAVRRAVILSSTHFSVISTNPAYFQSKLNQVHSVRVVVASLANCRLRVFLPNEDLKAYESAVCSLWFVRRGARKTDWLSTWARMRVAPIRNWGARSLPTLTRNLTFCMKTSASLSLVYLCTLNLIYIQYFH